MSGCSKYCLALLYTGKVLETKKFKRTMNLISTFDKPLCKTVQKRVIKTVKNLNSLKKIVPKAPIKSNTSPKNIELRLEDKK